MFRRPRGAAEPATIRQLAQRTYDRWIDHYSTVNVDDMANAASHVIDPGNSFNESTVSTNDRGSQQPGGSQPGNTTGEVYRPDRDYGVFYEDQEE
jgi:hypothetical protein